MSVSSIGVQIVMPKTGTSPEHNPQHEANDREAAEAPPKQAPPPSGMGKHVDRTV